ALGLAAELSFRAALAGDTRHLGGEGGQLMNHRVERSRCSQELALERPAGGLEVHFLREIAFSDRADDAGGLDRGTREVGDQCVYGSDGRRPGALDVSQRGAFRDPALLADELTQPGELQAHLLVELDDVVE